MTQPKPVTGQVIVHFEVDTLVRTRLEPESGMPFVRHLCELLGHRVRQGQEKYGTPLMTFNGRSAVQDAWEEAVDLVYYLQQRVIELRTDGSSRERIWFARLRDQAFGMMATLTELLPGAPE